MRSFRLAAVAASLLLTSIVVTACAASPEGESASPTPMFASDEEAFAAAEATYAEFIAATNSALANPDDSSRQSALLVGAAYADELRAHRDLLSSGRSVTGEYSVNNVTRISADDITVTLAACLDASQTRLLSASGEDITPSNRDAIVPLKLTFALVGGSVLLSESIGYPGSGSC